jgi:hypothetical protein
MTDEKKPRKRKVHYINNLRFVEELTKHRDRLKVYRDQGLPDPILPDYIGECFMNIANKYSMKPNFYGYPFREEMVYDAIENCVRYYESFDPEKGKNAFAYFTQVTHYAFLRRIEKEKLQLYIRHKSLENFMMENVNSGDINDGLLNDGSGINLTSDYMNGFVTDFEAKQAAKKATAKIKKGQLDIETE